MLPVRASDLFIAPSGEVLFAAYAEECSIEAIGKPNPQPEIYRMMEDAGVLKCFGLYDGPRLVGFASVLISVLPHYGKQVATSESIFVSKEYRGIGSGRLLNNVLAYSKASGCVVLLCIAPEGSEFEAFLIERDDCVRTNSVFCWRLAA